MKEQSPLSDGNKRLLRFVGSSVAITGTFLGLSAIGLEARRVQDGDFCNDSVRTQNHFSEEELKAITDCAPDVVNGLMTLIGGVGITVGVVTRKHTR